MEVSEFLRMAMAFQGKSTLCDHPKLQQQAFILLITI